MATGETSLVLARGSAFDEDDPMGVPQPSAPKKVEHNGGIRMDSERWKETFWLLQENGLADRGARLALTVATLKRKGDEIQQQIDALRLAEGNLLQAAKDEVEKNRGQAESGSRMPKDNSQAKTWGTALANAVALQAKEANDEAAWDEPPYAATRLAQEAEQQVRAALEAQQRLQAEAEAQAVVEAQQALLLQAQAVAQAQVIAEEQAHALEQAQAQAEVVAQMQAQLHAEATMAQEQQAELEAQLVERNALRAQGLNSKKLPLRPGVPACSYFMRKGECKYGRTCKWDHPEVTVNTKGYPMRPGETPCAFYLRTGICKFSSTCKFDHPEHVTPSVALAATGGVGGLLGNLLGGGGAPGGGLEAQIALLIQAATMAVPPASATDVQAAAATQKPQISPDLKMLTAAGEAKKDQPITAEQEQLLALLLQQASQDLGAAVAGAGLQ
mmetsp:Transcript_89445/g.251918  ORF Transcript_89445/g.251918 Transcript_89445/m.251918 type:complete len:444 (+) Transcript_89445:84-1415(+)